MKTIVSFLLLSLLILPSYTNTHKYYVSITEISYNPKTDKIEVGMRVFYDDLQNAILRSQGRRIDDPIQDYAKEIEEYIHDQFSITKNETAVPLRLIKLETEIDAIWIYLESDTIEFTTEWSIRNTTFIELFPTQNNIINFYPNKFKTNKVKGLALNIRKKEGEIHFKNVN